MKKIIAIVAVAILFSGCNLYKKYEKAETVPDNLYGDASGQLVKSDTSSNLGDMSWRAFFSDPILQNLIDSALVNNTNLKQAHLQVEEMQATVKAAKLAYIPSFGFTPYYQYNLANPTQTQSYNVAISAEWQIEIFGSLTNDKRKKQALEEQARNYEQATKVELISTMANLYYQLLMADNELAILMKTDSVWQEGVETQRAMMEAGLSYSPAVRQLEASLYSVRIQIADMINLINTYENSICQLLCQTPHHIDRSKFGEFTMPKQVGIGYPISVLSNRPDVRAAENNVAAAHYATCGARSAMYPQITLGGTFGFGSNSIAITPGQVLINVLAQLTQPIFAQGTLRANLNIAKAKQKEAELAFAQKVIDAGTEVNNAMANCQKASAKESLYKLQVAALEEAYYSTNDLMQNGKYTYLEVLTAQESYLAAQLSQASNHYESIRSLISLYVALGGGED